VALSRGRHAVLRVIGGTCPATNPTPLSALGTGGVEARTLLPLGLQATPRQPEGMNQSLRPVTAATPHTIDLPPRTLLARRFVIMRANPALGSLDFRLTESITLALGASLCGY